MIQSSVDQIRSELDAIESDAALREETNFVGRAAAADRIDALEFALMNRSDLNRCAQTLLAEFAAIDERIWQRLRVRIGDGSLRGESFRQELGRYVGRREPGRGYDALDVFVNGLFRLDGAPHETRALEPEMVLYQPTPARVILDLIEMTPLAPSDIFCDLGSGLGQVCLLVHLLTGAHTRGIEIEPAYCDYARQSARRLNLAQIEFVSADARAADYSTGTIFFMYTPFKGALLDRVLQKIENETRRRAIRICAYGACANQISNQSWLAPVASSRVGQDALTIWERKIEDQA